MHGIDTGRFHPAGDKAEAVRAVGLDTAFRYVGCFGRVRRQKGTDLFVDAMIALLPKHPEWAAVVAGRATAQHKAFEDELRARVAAAGLRLGLVAALDLRQPLRVVSPELGVEELEVLISRGDVRALAEAVRVELPDEGADVVVLEVRRQHVPRERVRVADHK